MPPACPGEFHDRSYTHLPIQSISPAFPGGGFAAAGERERRRRREGRLAGDERNDPPDKPGAFEYRSLYTRPAPAQERRTLAVAGAPR